MSDDQELAGIGPEHSRRLGAEDLRAIIANEPEVTLGNFRHEEVTDEGQRRSWRITLPEGFGWLAAQARYREQFGEAPGWLSRYFPGTRRRLVDLALETARPLPDQPSV